MEYTQITKQVIDFQKMSFNNWYNALTLAQEQANSAVGLVLEQNSWMPEQGRKAVTNWIGACQEESARFKSYIDEGFAGIEKYLGESKKAAQPKARK